MKKMRSAARSYWMSALLLAGIALAAYLVWPYLVAYLNASTVRLVINRNARHCAQGRTELCMDNIFNGIQAETGMALLREEITCPEAEWTHVIFDVNYRTELHWPYTDTLFGIKKKRFTRYTFRIEKKLSGY